MENLGESNPITDADSASRIMLGANGGLPGGGVVTAESSLMGAGSVPCHGALATPSVTGGGCSSTLANQGVTSQCSSHALANQSVTDEKDQWTTMKRRVGSRRRTRPTTESLSFKYRGLNKQCFR